MNAAPQRWSGVTGVLEAILVHWEAIDTMFEREGKPNPLDDWRLEIEELYSIFKPCTDVIVQCQLTSVPTGPTALFGLESLKLTTLNLVRLQTCPWRSTGHRWR